MWRGKAELVWSALAHEISSTETECIFSQGTSWPSLAHGVSVYPSDKGVDLGGLPISIPTRAVRTTAFSWMQTGDLHSVHLQRKNQSSQEMQV